MNPGVASGLLQLINAAVTPVVLISACAALILGINTKHTAIADRIRIFAGELRGTSDTEERKAQIREEVTVFFRRYRLTWLALASLYAAIFAFVLMILLIILAQKHIMNWEAGIVAMFLVGIGLTLCAVVFEICEVRLSIRSLEIELRDVT